MSLEILQTHTGLIPELSRFLAASDADVPARFVEPSFLEWKFFMPRPDWSGPRSFVVIDQGVIVAHVGLWPGLLALAGSPTVYVHPTDWFAAPSHPGIGFMLMRHALRSAAIGIVVGGTADSHALLPRLGFRLSGGMDVHARTVRPWKRGVSGKVPSRLKAAARALRDTARSLDRVPARPPGWATESADDQLSVLQHFQYRPSTSGVHSLQSPDSLRYLLRCPHVNARLTTLSREGRVCGYFMLNSIGGQCRIVDIRLQSARPDDWHSAYTLALLAATDDETTSEVVAETSLPWAGAILSRCGMRRRRQKPIFLADRAERDIRGLPLSLQLTDSDKFCYPE